MKRKVSKFNLFIVFYCIVLVAIMCWAFVLRINSFKEYEQQTGTEYTKPEIVVEASTVKITNATEDTKESNSPELISLGKFKLTAYCSCSKCCGKWASNRPKDENGKEIVRGSTGKRLIGGVSIAVDPKIISYESKVIINGKTYIAHDTGGAIKGKRIDVYFDSHQEALNFGVQYAEVHMLKV